MTRNVESTFKSKVIESIFLLFNVENKYKNSNENLTTTFTNDSIVCIRREQPIYNSIQQNVSIHKSIHDICNKISIFISHISNIKIKYTNFLQFKQGKQGKIMKWLIVRGTLILIHRQIANHDFNSSEIQSKFMSYNRD